MYDPVFNKKVTKVSERNKTFEDTCPPGPPPAPLPSGSHNRSQRPYARSDNGHK